MQTIPPTELVKHLNQVDLKALKLVNKEFYAIFAPFCNKIREFWQTRADVLYMEYSFVEVNTVKVKYNLLAKELSKEIVVHGKKPYKKFDLSIVVDFIKATNISIKLGDIIKLKREIGLAFVPLFVLEKKYIPTCDKFKHKQLYGDVYICESFDMVPFQSFSPYHWTNFSDFNHILIPTSRIRFYPPGSEELKYIEIIFEKFCFRLDFQYSASLPSDSEYMILRLDFLRSPKFAKVYYLDDIFPY